MEHLWRKFLFSIQNEKWELLTKGDFALIAASANMAVVRKKKCTDV